MEAIRDACPGASYEMVLRRLPVIAMEREATFFATIVDDRRIYFRRSSSNPWLPFRRMLPQEALAWQRAIIAPERRIYTLREPVKRGWVPLRGKRSEAERTTSEGTAHWEGGAEQRSGTTSSGSAPPVCRRGAVICRMCDRDLPRPPPHLADARGAHRSYGRWASGDRSTVS